MPGAYTNIGDTKMKILRAEYTYEIYDDKLPGEIVKGDSKAGLLVKTGDGVLELTEIQMPNLKKMEAKEYLRGHNLNCTKFN